MVQKNALKKSKYAIEIKNLVKSFGDLKVIKNISLTFKEGNTIGLIGHNGCGKSTLFNLVCGLLIPNSGEIVISGWNLKTDSIKIREAVSYLADGIKYYEHLSINQNMTFFCDLCDKPHDKIDEYLKLVGLEDFKYKVIKGFSKGMMQRLSIAISLIKEPKIMLMDEPTAGVDPKGVEEFNQLIVKLNKEKKITIVVSSHYLEEIFQVCDDVIVMKKGEIVVNDTIENIKKKNKNKRPNQIFMKYYTGVGGEIEKYGNNKKKE